MGTWSTAGRKLELEPFGRLPAGARAALSAEADDVARVVATSARPS